jgi:hypothetical protein
MQSSSPSETVKASLANKESQPNPNRNEYPILDPPSSVPKPQPASRPKKQSKLTKQEHGVLILIDDPNTIASRRERKYSIAAGVLGLVVAILLLIGIVLAICLSIKWDSN